MLNQEANVHITFRPSVDSRYIRPEHRAILEKACLQSGNLHPVITSGYRNISRQVRIMYDNLIRDYVGQRRLYLSAGAKLIDTYDQCLEKGFSRERTLAAMTEKAKEIGPEKISRHCAETCVFDIATGSLENIPDFISAIGPLAKKVLDERRHGNRCIHVEL